MWSSIGIPGQVVWHHSIFDIDVFDVRIRRIPLTFQDLLEELWCHIGDRATELSCRMEEVFTCRLSACGRCTGDDILRDLLHEDPSFVIELVNLDVDDEEDSEDSEDSEDDREFTTPFLSPSPTDRYLFVEFIPYILPDTSPT